jgi:hypothetical protein
MKPEDRGRLDRLLRKLLTARPRQKEQLA